MKRFLHMMVGVAIICGCYSSTMATEIEEQSVAHVIQEEVEDAKIADTQAAQEIEEVAIGQEVVNYAKQFIGTPYVSGGTDLNKGVDCSGFTQQVYKNFGIQLERRSRDQYACNGYAVSRADLKEGDLVFYGYGSVNHVAIYVGNDQVIHAPVPGKSVCIVPIQQRGDAPIIGYKRIF